MASQEFLPKSDVTLSWTPPNATVKLDGETYTQSPVKVKLTDTHCVQFHRIAEKRRHPIPSPAARSCCFSLRSGFIAQTERFNRNWYDLPYTAEASAAGYHSQSVRWDTEKQKSLHIDLKQITAAEIAAQKAEEQRIAQKAAAAQSAPIDRERRAAKELDDGTFIVKCEDLVRQQLKAPSTAKFPGTMESLGGITNWDNGNKDWSGWVDSQNSFGAMLRIEFLCEYDLDSQKIELTLKN